VVQRVVHQDDLTPRDRLAAILVLVLGQQIEDVVQLTWDQASVTEKPATITVGAAPVSLDSPLDERLRRLMDDPGHGQTAAHPNSLWIFRGNPSLSTLGEAPGPSRPVYRTGTPIARPTATVCALTQPGYEPGASR
jgi:hypothetical protein